MTDIRSVTRYGSRSYRPAWGAFLVVALVQACYGAGFILRSSFVVEGRRYFCLFDDAMISMRYASNWANGQGFVWNAGERVEGYTSFAWTALMGFCHLLPLSPSGMCLLVQLLGIPVLWSCSAATVLLARSCRLMPAVACSAVVLSGTYYNLLFFSLFGMETGLLTALVTWGQARAAHAVRRKEGSTWSVLWLGPALLVRPDVLPLAPPIVACVLLTARRYRRRVLLGLLVAALPVVSHLLWRYEFYGQWLPNTYYLKATGWPIADRIGSGLIQAQWTAGCLGLAALFVAAAATRPKRWYVIPLSCFAVSIATRFISVGTPGLWTASSSRPSRVYWCWPHRVFTGS